MRRDRPLPDSNRGWRICNPLPYRLAKGPESDWIVAARLAAVNVNCRRLAAGSKHRELTPPLQLAAQGFDAVAALVARGRVGPGIDPAGFQVIEHHCLGGDVVRTRLEHGRGDFVRNGGHAISVAV